MSNGWRPATLGNAFTLVRAKVSPGELAPETLYVGLEHIEPGSPRLGDGGRAADVSSLVTPFLPGDTLFGRLRPYLRKVALADKVGVCTPEVLVLRPTASVLPGFLHLLASAPSTIEHAVAASAGTRMPRTSPTDLARIEVALPPLDVQRRIVDLVGAVDAHIANLRAGAERAAELRVQVLLTSLHSSDAHPTPLGACMQLDLGRQAVDRATGYRVFGVLNRGQGLVDKGAIRGADTGYTHLNRVRAGQLVMRKLTAWEGPIAIVPAQFDGYFGSAEFPSFTLNAERLLPAFMSHVCGWPGLWSEMKQNVTGSVQRRKRLNPEQLLSVVIPVPPLPEQRLAADALDAILAAEEALRRESAEAAGLRSILLDALLSREVEIPEAYDRLMDAGVA